MATIKVQQTRSRIGATVAQKRTLDALGLTKLYHVVELEANACTLGMLRKVHHLVTVVE